MTKRRKILSVAGLGLVGLLLAALAVTYFAVQTDWFREFVRNKIIASTEESTGGKVEVGAFAFDVSHLRAVVTNFTIHGKEPADAAPFLTAARVEVDLRLFTSIKHLLDITYLAVEKPRLNILVLNDGTTNIPSPKEKQPASNTTPLETVVNLAVDRFNLADGLITADATARAFDLRGNNLTADLRFNRIAQSYTGNLGLEPVYVAAGKNTPVQFRIQLPVTLEKDRVELKNATITTPASALSINGTLQNLRKPVIAARVAGHLDLADVKNLADLPITVNSRDVPALIDVDANLTASDKAIDVTGLRLGIGESNFEASGHLKDSQGHGNLQFKASLMLGELGRLARVAAKPDGVVELNGVAKLDAANNFDIGGNLQGKNLSFLQGSGRIANLNVQSAIHVDPHRAELQGLRVNAFGGDFLGNVSLEDFRFYQIDGNLRGLDIQSAGRSLGAKPLPYTGVISGPLHASGDIKGEGAKAITAHANLAITPGHRGIPVSGKLNAVYNGASGSVTIDNSFIALPHTRLTLNGSLNRQVSISLTSRDLSDLLAAFSPGPPPIVLTGGTATFNGTVRGELSNPSIAGRFDMNRFSVQGRAFETLSAELAASGTGASVRNGTVTRGPMAAEFSAKAGLYQWTPLPREPLTADVAVRGGDLADVLALAGQAPAGYSGTLTATAHVQGTIGNPQGSAEVQATSGTLDNEPFDHADFRVVMADRLVSVPSAFITSGARRIDLSAEFQHPPDSLGSGQLHAHVKTNELDLAAVHALQQQDRKIAGAIQLDADVRGNLTEGEGDRFLLTQLTANATAKRLEVDGQNYGDATLSANTTGKTVNYDLTSDFAGSAVHVNGRTQLTRNYPTTADANISRLPVERVVALAKQTIPARGILSGTAHFRGTVADPEGGVDLDLSSAVLYDEPLDRVRLHMDYRPDVIDLTQLEITQGPAHLALNGRFEHPPNDFTRGNVQFKIDSSKIDLTKIRNAQRLRPGLGGTVEISASGAGAVRAKDPKLELSTLNANIEASALMVERRSLGNLSLKAGMTSAQQVRFVLESNLAGSAIHGEGNAQLASGYPVDARLTFNNVTWNRLRDLLGPATGTVPTFDVVTDGSASVNGPVMNPDQLSGNLQITRLSLNTLPGAGVANPITVRNQGPIAVSLQNGTIQVESARLTGPQTDLQITGNASLPRQTLNINLSTTANLALLQSFNRDIVSSGGLTASAAVRGAFSKPQINGQIELKNASVNYTDLPNGIENANGVIVFGGTTATIRTLTAETGGGKLTASGFFGYANGTRFGLRAQAAGVRSRVQEGMSVEASADVRLTGTLESSTLSGNVTVEQLNYAPQSDLGAILSRSATPVKSDAAPSPLLENMKLDIHLQTSPSLGVQASIAQNLQASADLRVRGSAAQPGVVGRVTISEGELVFFGSTYTVNSGAIGFYDPLRIAPVLNVNLETQAKGVNVTLTVTGPIDNMKLSYTSDPPLQFQEIIALLASGKTPTSDPTLLANQPQQPSQSFEQMGESAIVGKALADPITSRMQRVFGVTQLKIDPAFTGGSQIPTARLTFQQQITSNVTFTYTSALDDPNSTVIRAEWSFNPQYSAIASRDQNGLVSVLLFYKKQLR